MDATTESSSDESDDDEVDSSNQPLRREKKIKAKPSDELDKKLLMQNFALQNHNFDLYKRAA
jgi:hypothetical protein